MIVSPQAFGEKAPTTQELQREQDEFFKKLLPSLDKQLEGKKFFCGEDNTIADIQYYCEISTILSLTKKTLEPAEYPNLSPWYNERLSQIPDIMQLDRKLKELLAKYNFQWRTEFGDVLLFIVLFDWEAEDISRFKE